MIQEQGAFVKGYNERIMLATRIIPCLDVQNGRVVKGTHFLNLRDAGDPVERAALYDAQGRGRIGIFWTSPPHTKSAT